MPGKELVRNVLSISEHDRATPFGPLSLLVVLDFLTMVEARTWAERDPIAVPGEELLPR